MNLLKLSEDWHSAHLYPCEANPISGQISGVGTLFSEATICAQILVTLCMHLWWTQKLQSEQMYEAWTTLQMTPVQWSQCCRDFGVLLIFRSTKWWPRTTWINVIGTNVNWASYNRFNIIDIDVAVLGYATLQLCIKHLILCTKWDR